MVGRRFSELPPEAEAGQTPRHLRDGQGGFRTQRAVGGPWWPLGQCSLELFSLCSLVSTSKTSLTLSVYISVPSSSGQEHGDRSARGVGVPTGSQPRLRPLVPGPGLSPHVGAVGALQFSQSCLVTNS